MDSLGAGRPTSVKLTWRQSETRGSWTVSQEVHVFNKFEEDFYGEEIRVIVLGYVRPEQNYDSLGGGSSDLGFVAVSDTRAHSIASSRPAPLHSTRQHTDALIADIQMDIQVSKNSLARPAYGKFANDAFMKPRL